MYCITVGFQRYLLLRSLEGCCVMTIYKHTMGVNGSLMGRAEIREKIVMDMLSSTSDPTYMKRTQESHGRAYITISKEMSITIEVEKLISAGNTGILLRLGENSPPPSQIMLRSSNTFILVLIEKRDLPTGSTF